jgi:acyl carrier protein
MPDIERELTAFIVENFLFGNADQAPDPDDSFMDDGLVDSTGVLELVTYIEGRYEITVNDDDLTPENLDSVRSIARFVQRKRGA